MKLVAVLLLVLVFAGCDRDAAIQKFSSPEIQAEAKGYIAKLRSRDFASIEAALDRSIDPNAARPSLVQMADLIPAGSPTSVTLVGARRGIENSIAWSSSTFEYQFGSRWLLVEVNFREGQGARKILAFHVVPQPASLDEQNAFTLAGKSAVHFMVLTAAVASAALTLVALVACVRAKLPGRKWPWILFILVGFGNLSLNWTTGALHFQPLYLLLFSAGVRGGWYAPYIVSAAVPVGAIVFLYKLRRWRAAPPPAAIAQP